MTAARDRTPDDVEGSAPAAPPAQQPDFPDRRRRLAVLIDAENASHKTIPDLLATIETHGTAVIRRAYGDWRSSSLDAWRPLLAATAIRPIQRSRIRSGPGRGRNAADIALVVDAMDLLHTAPLDGFCIVSSDSDFADLALRIKEAGLMVIGVGRQATPEAFQACCTVFIPTDAAGPPPASQHPAAGSAAPDEASRVTAYRTALELAPTDGAWRRVTDLGDHVPKAARAKHPKTWLDGRAEFSVELRQFRGKGPDVWCVRLEPPAGS